MQSETIRFLSRAETFGVGGVRLIETHISIVFLAGRRAYKLKKAVRFPYLDFTTPELRRTACEAEVAINRRTAPGMYLGVQPVTRGACGGLRLSGDGEAVDWLVEMARFDQDDLFDSLARRGGLDRRLMEETAEAIAEFHQGAEKRMESGGADAMAAIIDNNAACFGQRLGDALDRATVESLNAASGRVLDRTGGRLDKRRRAGLVRHCHGDLHLGNIVLEDGRPTLFDAIEFNVLFADIDVLYDLAFLLMDLEHHGLGRLASMVLNRYLDVTGDEDGLAQLPLFLSLRAAVRAHVNAATAAGDPDRAAGLMAEAGRYLEAAFRYLSPPPPRLVALGGFSGSGKSRLARELAPLLGARPGARVTRSDILRKRLAGVPATTRLGAGGYTESKTEKTYETLYDVAGKALASGHSAIADAVFANPGQRRAIARVAERAGVPFRGLWLEAPRRTLEQRVRERQHNPSDATPEVIGRQLGYDLGPMEWERVDSSGMRKRTMETAVGLLGPAMVNGTL